MPLHEMERPPENRGAHETAGQDVRTSVRQQSDTGLQIRRRRSAADRCEPLACGHRDPLDCRESCSERQEPRRFNCDQCLTFSVGERERLGACWEDRRCPLAGRLQGVA